MYLRNQNWVSYGSCYYRRFENSSSREYPQRSYQESNQTKNCEPRKKTSKKQHKTKKNKDLEYDSKRSSKVKDTCDFSIQNSGNNLQFSHIFPARCLERHATALRCGNTKPRFITTKNRFENSKKCA